MSSINVNLTELNAIKRSLEKTQSRLTRAADGAASVHVDGKILARRNIGSRIASANRSIQELEGRVAQLLTFLGNAAQQYENAEDRVDKLLSEMQDFREKRSAWDWIVDQAEYVGDKAKDAWVAIDKLAQETLDLLNAYTSLMSGLIDEATTAVNQWLDSQRDWAIAHGSLPIMEYFINGVLKCLVSSVGGIVKLLIEAPLMRTKSILIFEGEVTDVAMSEDPFQMLKDDIMSIPDKFVAVGTAIKQTVVDSYTEFVKADINHKAEKIGFATGKILELLIPVLGEASLAKNAALGARSAASVASEGGARGLAAIAREGSEQLLKSLDDVINQALKNSMDKILNFRIRDPRSSLLPEGVGGIIPGNSTTLGELLENMGWINKMDAPEGSGKLPEGTGKGGKKFSDMSADEQIAIAKQYAQKAPIEIPESASMKAKSMADGYEQITYKWNDGTYKYEVRWHSRTSGAPADQGNTWVIQRTIPGSGGNKPQSFFKIGEDEWVEGYKWYDAIAARKAGTATPEQVRILDQGHWKE